MTTTTSRLTSYGMGLSSTTERTSQSAVSSFGNSAWTPNSNTIWGNGSVIGGSLAATRRDLTIPRDAASPTAPSGSAQLNHQSEAEPWVPRTGSVWSHENPTQMRRSSANSSSPGDNREKVSLPEQYLSRSSFGQNGTAYPNRSSLNPSSGSIKFQPTLHGYADAVEESKSLYAGPGQTNEPYLRDWQGEGGLHSGVSRQNSVASQRASDWAVGYASSSGPAGFFPDPLDYSAPLPRAKVSASHAPTSRGGGFEHNLQMGRGEGLIAELGPTQPFQFNPGSQEWSNDDEGHGRGLASNRHESFADQASELVLGLKRASLRLDSPNWARPSHAAAFPPFVPRPWARHACAHDMTSPPGGPPYMSYPPYHGMYNAHYGGQMLPQGVHFDTYRHHGLGYRQPAGYGNPMPPFLPSVQIPSRPARAQESGRGARSVLLEQFRASNNRGGDRFDLKQIYNHIVEFAGDQHGSRFIQRKLETANSDEKEQVFRELEPNALQLMKDVFGNYVIQKFFEHGSQLQKKMIAAQMKTHVVELCFQMYACRVVQKALEHVLHNQQQEIIDEIRPRAMDIFRDSNGNHVIQKMISVAPKLCVSFIMDSFRGKIGSLGTHIYGCRIIQRILEYGSEAEKQEIMAEVQTCAPHLIEDQYGNYVAQHIIQKGSPEDRSIIICHVLDDFLNYSRHKFASNVVEKCITHATPDQHKTILAKLSSRPDVGPSPLLSLIKDQYGNYVVQTLVKEFRGSDQEALMRQVRPHIEELKRVAAVLPSPLASGRHLQAVDRLEEAIHFAEKSAAKTGTRLGLQLDVNSVLATPVLTTEENSPESNCAPSTHLSTEEDNVVGVKNILSAGRGQGPIVRGEMDDRSDGSGR